MGNMHLAMPIYLIVLKSFRQIFFLFSELEKEILLQHEFPSTFLDNFVMWINKSKIHLVCTKTKFKRYKIQQLMILLQQ